jgi:hypothetical protein
MTREELENHFFRREPYALITIRRPKSKFVNLSLLDGCVGIRELLFYFDVGSTPFNDRRRFLAPVRQATNLVRFVNDIKNHCSILVCQCESGDSLATSIAQPLSRWLETPIMVGKKDFGINRHVTTLVEMAIEWSRIEKSLTAKSE